MPVITPFVYTAPPAVAPYLHGLLTAATVVEQPSPHVFYGGIEFESLACYLSATYPGGLTDVNGSGGAKVLPACLGVTQAAAFAVYGGVAAGSVGHNESGNAYWTERARGIVELAAQHAVESALWTGTAGAAPALNSAATPLIVPGQANTAAGSYDLLTGLALAENYLASNYAGQGVIHLPRAGAIYLAQLQQLKSEPDHPEQITTALGTKLVFGGGYDGTGPGGLAAPAGTGTSLNMWMYATGAVLAMHGAIDTPGTFAQALDRAGNQVRLYAEQSWLVAVDCLKAGILVHGGTP